MIRVIGRDGCTSCANVHDIMLMKDIEHVYIPDYTVCDELVELVRTVNNVKSFPIIDIDGVYMSFKDAKEIIKI